MGCKSKYRDNEAFGLQEGCSSVSQGRALEPAGDRRSREMTVAPQGEQNPAYSLASLIHKRVPPLRNPFRFCWHFSMVGMYPAQNQVDTEIGDDRKFCIFVPDYKFNLPP